LWLYWELVSCPLVVLLGRFEYKSLEGLVALPLLNLRVSILRRDNGSLRVVSNIPYSDWRALVENLCSLIVNGQLPSAGSWEEAMFKSMMYGGLGLYIKLNRGYDVLTLDFVDTTSFKFYLSPRPLSFDIPVYNLEDLVVLQYALRRGDRELVSNVCASITGGECALNTSHGVLLITETPPTGRGFMRVVPDNTPLRHVIKH